MGDILRPLPLWNNSEGNPKRYLNYEVEVLDVKSARSQSGHMVLVEMAGGMTTWLDRGWFDETR